MATNNHSARAIGRLRIFPVYFLVLSNPCESLCINLNDLVHTEYNCCVNQVLLIEAHHLRCILVIFEDNLLGVKIVESNCLPPGD